MEGLSLDNELNKGIIPRMMNYVFGLVGQGGQDKTYRLECSFLEIYNERINDLLDTKRSNL
jgi:kinesin family protein 5